jgi:hypothetical protein
MISQICNIICFHTFYFYGHSARSKDNPLVLISLDVGFILSLTFVNVSFVLNGTFAFADFVTSATFA